MKRILFTLLLLLSSVTINADMFTVMTGLAPNFNTAIGQGIYARPAPAQLLGPVTTPLWTNGYILGSPISIPYVLLQDEYEYESTAAHKCGHETSSTRTTTYNYLDEQSGTITNHTGYKSDLPPNTVVWAQIEYKNKFDCTCEGAYSGRYFKESGGTRTMTVNLATYVQTLTEVAISIAVIPTNSVSSTNIITYQPSIQSFWDDVALDINNNPWLGTKQEFEDRNFLYQGVPVHPDFAIEKEYSRTCIVDSDDSLCAANTYIYIGANTAYGWHPCSTTSRIWIGPSNSRGGGLESLMPMNDKLWTSSSRNSEFTTTYPPEVFQRYAFPINPILGGLFDGAPWYKYIIHGD